MSTQFSFGSSIWSVVIWDFVKAILAWDFWAGTLSKPPGSTLKRRETHTPPRRTKSHECSLASISICRSFVFAIKITLVELPRGKWNSFEWHSANLHLITHRRFYPIWHVVHRPRKRCSSPLLIFFALDERKYTRRNANIEFYECSNSSHFDGSGKPRHYGTKLSLKYRNREENYINHHENFCSWLRWFTSRFPFITRKTIETCPQKCSKTHFRCPFPELKLDHSTITIRRWKLNSSKTGKPINCSIAVENVWCFSGKKQKSLLVELQQVWNRERTRDGQLLILTPTLCIFESQRKLKKKTLEREKFYFGHRI